MDLQLTGKTAVVTGASRGIGLAVTEALVAEGVRVVAGARSSSAALDELAGRGEVEIALFDLSDPAAPATLMERAGGRLDILVNNVGGVTPRLDGFLSVTDEQWMATLNLDFLAAVRATRAAIPRLLEGGGGAIVNVSSVNAFLPDPGVIDYSVAKAAITNVSKSISKEFGSRGIRVNCVSPGPVATDLWLGSVGVGATIAEATGGSADDVAAQAVAGAATGRFTTPQEVADLVVFLASDRAANVTGTSVTIDGGLVQTL